MKTPNFNDDRFVRVQAFMIDEGFGCDNWHAAQFSAPSPRRPAVLVICANEAEQDECLAFLTERAERNGTLTPKLQFK